MNDGEKLRALEQRVSELEEIVAKLTDPADPLVTRSFASRAVWLLQQYTLSLIWFTSPSKGEASDKAAKMSLGLFTKRLDDEVFTDEEKSDGSSYL